MKGVLPASCHLAAILVLVCVYDVEGQLPNIPGFPGLPSFPGLPTLTDIQSACEIIPGSFRTECRAPLGLPVVSVAQCLTQGCCADERAFPFRGCFRISLSVQRAFCAFIRPELREDCGSPGISQGACQSRGCCFDSSRSNTIFCYRTRPRLQCLIGTAFRRDCGFSGISRSDCMARSCCYDASMRNRNFCFTPANQPINSVSNCAAGRGSRRDCGFRGIRASDCLARGCCFDSSRAGTNFCFIPVFSSLVTPPPIPFTPFPGPFTPPQIPFTPFPVPFTPIPPANLCNSIPFLNRISCPQFVQTISQCINARCCYEFTRNICFAPFAG